MDIDLVLGQLGTLPLGQRKEVLDFLEELNEAKGRRGAHEDFLEFVRQVWPAFIEGDHHRIMADAFNRIADGDLRRLILTGRSSRPHTPQNWRSVLGVRFVTWSVLPTTARFSRMLR